MYHSTELPFQHVNFDSPQSIEVTKLTSPTFIQGNTPETQIYIRLQCPNVQKPNVIIPSSKTRSRKIWNHRLLSCLKPSLEEDEIAIHNTDIFSQWSQLIESKDAFRNGDWVRVSNNQQPSNGQIWMRATQHRICLMILICGRNTHLEKTATTSLSSAAFSSMSSINLYDQSVESLKTLFPTYYYYWDSGQIKPGFEATKSRISVTDNNIYLVLAPIGDCSNVTWIDRDIALLQQTCNSMSCFPTSEESRGMHMQSFVEISAQKLQRDGNCKEECSQSDTDSQHALTAGDSNFAEFERLEREVEVLEAIQMKATVVLSSKTSTTPSMIPAVLEGEREPDGESKKVDKLDDLSATSTEANLFMQRPRTVILNTSEEGSHPRLHLEKDVSPIIDQKMIIFPSAENRYSGRPSPQEDSLHSENRMTTQSELINKTMNKIEDSANAEAEEDTQPTTEPEEDCDGKPEKSLSGQPKQVQDPCWNSRLSTSQIPIRSHYREAGDNDTSRRPSTERWQQYRQTTSTMSSSDSKSIQTTFMEMRTIMPHNKEEKKSFRELVSIENHEATTKQIHRRRRRRSEPRRKTMELPDCISEQFEGLDMIRWKLESMTDDQWNQVLDILNGHTDVRTPLRRESTRELSPRPRKPRAANTANFHENCSRKPCTQMRACHLRRM